MQAESTLAARETMFLRELFRYANILLEWACLFLSFFFFVRFDVVFGEYIRAAYFRRLLYTAPSLSCNGALLPLWCISACGFGILDFFVAFLNEAVEDVETPEKNLSVSVWCLRYFLFFYTLIFIFLLTICISRRAPNEYVPSIIILLALSQRCRFYSNRISTIII